MMSVFEFKIKIVRVNVTFVVETWFSMNPWYNDRHFVFLVKNKLAPGLILKVISYEHKKHTE